MARVTSSAGLNIIKKYEGCKLTAYLCPAGVWTIGYGHTGGVTKGMTITQAKADSYLKSDVAKFEKNVNGFDGTYKWTQNEFDALVSFAFNLGSINTLTANGSRSKATIAAKIPEYNKAGGVVLQGLVKRRAEEKALFLKASSSSGSTGSGSSSSGDSTIKSFQSWLNSNYSAGLTADGVYGTLTKKAATKAYQKVLGVTADGAFGANSKAAVKTLQSGSSGNAVRIMQGMLHCRGFNPNGVDGIFGSGCTTAVKKFQTSKGLTSDGKAGANTMYALYN